MFRKHIHIKNWDVGLKAGEASQFMPICVLTYYNIPNN